MFQRKRTRTYNPALEKFIGYLFILLGSGIVAIAFNLFLLPNQIASGGVSGISTITDSLFGFEPAYVQWAFNIPLFIAGVLLLGKQFGLKTLIGTIFLPFVVFFDKGYGASDNRSLAWGDFWRNWRRTWSRPCVPRESFYRRNRLGGSNYS